MLSALLICSYAFIVGGCNLIATEHGRCGRCGLSVWSELCGVSSVDGLVDM